MAFVRDERVCTFKVFRVWGLGKGLWDCDMRCRAEGAFSAGHVLCT